METKDQNGTIKALERGEGQKERQDGRCLERERRAPKGGDESTVAGGRELECVAGGPPRGPGKSPAAPH